LQVDGGWKMEDDGETTHRTAKIENFE